MKLFSRHSHLGPLLLCLAGALIACTAAEAATHVVTWTNPVQNTDDTAIPASGEGSLASARIEWGTCSAAGVFGTAAGSVARPRGTGAMPTTATLNLPVGTSCMRVFVSNTYGSESGASNVTFRTIDAPTPKPPVMLTSAPQVYDVKPNESTFAFDRGRQVGSVKLGAACDEDRTTGGDFYALERPSQVKLIRAARSAALVAKCSPQAQASGNSPTSANTSDVHLDDGGRVLMGSRLSTAS